MILKCPIYIIVFGILLFPSYGLSEDYALELIKKSQELKLSHTKEWLVRGHYKKNTFGGYTSVIDSPEFFLAKDGKTSPKAELEATIKAFFEPYPDKADKDYQHPQCKFIGRYNWLKAKLDFDEKKLPEQECPKFEQWYKTLNPHQITMVYPSSYLNNPASMFGHTLLRIDTPNQTEQTRLNSYAINYSASTEETNGFIFALKGLFGAYKGHFSTRHYYEMVKEYSAFENRDIWEYQLNFTKEEMDTLLMHLWEIGDNYSWYYFFDENCSARLLYVLDVARPSLELAKGINWWVIPTDTIKEMDEKGLIKKAVYRPSEQTKLAFRAKETNRDIIKRISEGQDVDITNLPEEDQAKILETSYDYLQYLFNTDSKTREEIAKPSMTLLLKRSKIEAASNFKEVPAPENDVREAHGNPRISSGWGQIDSSEYLFFRIKPEYHDLLDNSEGFINGTEINIFDAEIRYYFEDDKLELERFQVAGIKSFAPRDKLFKPISWRVEGGIKQFYSGEDDRELTFYLDGGAGLTYQFGDFIISGFAEAESYLDNELPKGYLFGASPAVYGIYTPNKTFKLYAKTAYHFYTEEEYNNFSALLEGKAKIDNRISFRGKLKHQIYEDRENTDFSIGLQYYFN